MSYVYTRLLSKNLTLDIFLQIVSFEVTDVIVVKYWCFILYAKKINSVNPLQGKKGKEKEQREKLKKKIKAHFAFVNTGFMISK